MKSQNRFRSYLCVGLVLALALCGSAAAWAAKKTVTATFGHVYGPDTSTHLGAARFAELVRKYTDGEVVIEVFPSSQLGGERDLIESTEMNSVNFSFYGTVTYGNIAKSITAVSMPFLYRSPQEAYDLLDSAVGADVFSVVEKKNSKIIGLFENGFRQLGTIKKPVNSLADVKGLKVRVPDSQVYMNIWKSLGASPTPMAWNEVFSALQTGVIDGQEAPLGIFATSGFGEVCKQFAYIYYIYDPVLLAVNLDFWKSLSADHQEAIQKAAREASAWQRQNAQEIEAEQQKIMEEKWGVKFTKPDLAEFQKAVQPIYEQFEDQATLKKILDYLEAKRAK